MNGEFKSRGEALDYLDGLPVNEAVAKVMQGIDAALQAQEFTDAASLLAVLNRYSHEMAAVISKAFDDSGIPFEPNYEEIGQIVTYPRPTKADAP